MAYVSEEFLATWLEESCQAQGVPVKVRDARVIEGVRSLLTGRPEGSGRSASSDGSLWVAGSEAPDRRHPGQVHHPGAPRPGSDDPVVEDGSHDGGLAVEIEARPLSA
jgi:hypothetical protein